jgi:putative photosynthetic complex assembly protein
MTDATHARPAYRSDKELVPRAMLRAVAALALSVLVLVSYARISDRPLIATPPKNDVVATRDVLLSGDTSGAATVRAADGTVIADLTPQQGGFVSGVWRVILRERVKHRVSLDGPVRLIGHESGRVSIEDPSTGWSADLMGFGADNARAFERLLVQPEGGQ